MDPPSPSATIGIDDFFNVGEGGAIPGADEIVNISESESSSNDSPNTNERRVLPPELSKNVTVLTCESVADAGVCDVYVLGTSQLSMESCEEVEGVIQFLKPDVVFLELCFARNDTLAPHNCKVPTIRDMVKKWKNDEHLFGILNTWSLAKVACRLEVQPGEEFRVAFELAMINGHKVMLGDRPDQITLQRTWTKMPLWHKIIFVYKLLFRAVFLPSPGDDVDRITLIQIQELNKFPTVMETLVNERDRYMSTRLLKLAREHNSVVAVVGKAHVAGIIKNWQQPVGPEEMIELEMPAEKSRISMGKIVTAIGATVAGVAIFSRIYLSLKK